MFRTATLFPRKCLARTVIPRRQFALVNDISVRKRLTIGISGFIAVTAGAFLGGRMWWKRRKINEIPVIETQNPADILPPEIPVMESTHEDDYIPWWTGVKEVSIYLNEDNTKILDSHFSPVHPVVPRRKVVLVTNPLPVDSNEYGPLMSEAIEMKVVAMVSDEHAQVLLLDIGTVPSIYRYPHIVISCENEKDEQSYSSIYGRLLIDRAVKAGLLEEESESKYIPKEDVDNAEVGEYYAYPPSHISVHDLRNEKISFQGRLCTSRGMDGKNDICNEPKQEAECSWCVFMKSGPCCKAFTLWQECVKANKDDDSFVEKCEELTFAMQECVEAHPEYYGAISELDEEETKEVESEEE